MEWPFSFQTGPGKTAVIQLCANLDTCYVFHVSELAKLPAALIKILTHDAVCLHGVNVKKYDIQFGRMVRKLEAMSLIYIFDIFVVIAVNCNEISRTLIRKRWLTNV